MKTTTIRGGKVLAGATLLAIAGASLCGCSTTSASAETTVPKSSTQAPVNAQTVDDNKTSTGIPVLSAADFDQAAQVQANFAKENQITLVDQDTPFNVNSNQQDKALPAAEALAFLPAKLGSISTWVNVNANTAGGEEPYFEGTLVQVDGCLALQTKDDGNLFLSWPRKTHVNQDHVVVPNIDEQTKQVQSEAQVKLGDHIGLYAKPIASDSKDTNKCPKQPTARAIDYQPINIK